MKKRLLRSLIAWTAGISLMLTALPVSAFAMEGDSADEVHEGPYWVISEGKWYETGALLDDPPISIQMQNRAATVNYDPNIESVDLSESNYFPPIIRQDEGSCVAIAGVSYQFTYEMARHMNWNLKAMYDDEEELNQHIFSPAFIYNLCHGYDAEKNYHGGTNIWTVYDLLSTYGAAREADFVSFYDDPNERYPQIVADKWCQDTDTLLDALQYRVSSYEIGHFADASDPTAIDNGPDSTCLNEIKGRLQSGQLVSIGTAMTCGYMDVPGRNEKAIVSCYQLVGEESGGHQLTIVGYDDTISIDFNDSGTIEPNERGAFKVANSWSTDWQNGGFVWVMYDAFNLESAGNFPYEKQKSLAAENENKSEEKMGEIERLAFGGNYTYYCIEVDTYDPAMVAEVSFPLSDSYNSAYTVGLSTNTQYPNLRDLKKAIPNIDRATFYIDCTPMMGEAPYYAEDYNWRLRYRNAYDDTIGEPVQYKLKYYQDTADDYNQQSSLAYTDFASTGTTKNISLSLQLQTTQSGADYSIDHEKKFVYLSFAMSPSRISEIFMGGDLTLQSDSTYIGTGDAIQQKFLGRVFDEYRVVIYGDVYGDGQLNQLDAYWLQQMVDGAQLTAPYIEAAHTFRYYYGVDAEEITQRDADVLQQRVDKIPDLEPGAYTLQNIYGGYLEATGYDGSDPVRANASNGKNNQIVQIEPAEDNGFYVVRAMHKPSLLLTYNKDSNNVSFSYQIDADQDTSKQEWSIAYTAYDILLVPRQNPKKALALQNDNNAYGTKVVLAQRDDADTIHWHVTATKPQKTLEEGVYTIQLMVDGGTYWEAENAGTTNGTQIKMNRATEAGSQKWVVKYEEDGYYTIRPSYRTSICLTAADGGLILQWNSQLDTQRWLIVEGKNGDYRFAPKSAPQMVAKSEVLNRGLVVLGADNLYGDDSNLTKWICTPTTPVQEVEEGVYSFANRKSGLLLDVQYHEAHGGRRLEQNEDYSWNTQMWYVKPAPDGYYWICSYVDDSLVMATDGTTVFLSEQDGSDKQKWLFVKSDDGSYRLSSKFYPDKAAAVENGSVNLGARLILYVDNATANSRWSLTPSMSYDPDQSYGIYWRFGDLEDRRYLTASHSSPESGVYSMYPYNGKYTAYSTWTLQYQGNGYYKILNSRYQMYLGSDGASSITLENNSAEREDYLLWLITKDGFLVPKVNPDYVLSVAGHSAEDVHVILAEATSSSAIQWRIENRT